MRHLLAPENATLLEQLAWSHVLLAFDFDGTLAPIVSSRDSAVMRGRTAALFSQVCDRYPCAIISGRGKDDVAARLDGAAAKYIIGNHGLEPGAGLREFELIVTRALTVLRPALSSLVGIEIEDKRFSLALHYRKARQKNVARTLIQEAVLMLPMPMRVVPGKLVVNLVPEGAPNKGDALLQLRGLEGADTTIYFGDDVTDEDVFVLDQPGRVLGVRVGESRHSAATYFLRSQREIDRVLARFVGLRAERP